MPLTLTVRTVDRPAGTAPPPLRLFRRGAVIGRAPGADWTLPDDRSAVSSRHCEIAFRDGAYLIADSGSTNGTYLNGTPLSGAARLNDGDTIAIGPYTVAVQVMAEDMLAPPPPPPIAASAADGAGTTGAAVEHLLRHAGLRRADIRNGDAELLAAAGTLLRRATEGSRALLVARTKAKTELGAAADSNDVANPLKRGGTTEQILSALLGPPAPGVLPVDRATDEAFADLAAHQRATLRAMQGAMTATLDRFSPAAITAKAGPKANDAVLWQEYTKAFAGKPDPEKAFIEVFANEFRAAYEALAKG